MLNQEINRAFRARLDRGGAMLLPGAANALTARIIADLGFEALYLTGAGVTNTFLGVPDHGFVNLSELAEHTAAIRDITDLPIVVDADTGFGNALNVRHTIRRLERAGASAVQIEDQVSPKRCGHFAGKEVVDLHEARMRIRAAVDARQDPDMMIVARTDAAAGHGLDAAIERAALFVEEGADITFVEAPRSEDEIARIPRALAQTPQLVNLVVGGRTPIMPAERLDAMGFALILYANVALQGAIRGMQGALGQLKADGMMGEDGPVAGFAERQRLVDKPHHDALDARYAGK